MNRHASGDILLDLGFCSSGELGGIPPSSAFLSPVWGASHKPLDCGPLFPQPRRLLRVTKSLKITAIVLFVFVDLVAAAFAIRHVNQRPVSQGSSLSVPTETPSATVSTSVDPKTEDPTGLVVTGNVMARFVRGSCDDPAMASLELSTDSAANFKEIALPLAAKSDANGDRSAAVTSIRGVTLTTPAELSIVGTDADCKSYRYVTENGGQDWKRTDTGDEWYVDGAKVVTPAGRADAQCEVSSVWPISERNARVGCKDGQIRGTDDAGDTWVGLGALDGLSAVSFSTIRDGFGIAKTDGCASRVYATGSAGGNWEPLGCISDTKTAVAIGGAAALLAALVDGDVYVSTDQGESWDKP